jgi:hypothetical protein
MKRVTNGQRALTVYVEIELFARNSSLSGSSPRGRERCDGALGV